MSHFSHHIVRIDLQAVGLVVYGFLGGLPLGKHACGGRVPRTGITYAERLLAHTCCLFLFLIQKRVLEVLTLRGFSVHVWPPEPWLEKVVPEFAERSGRCFLNDAFQPMASTDFYDAPVSTIEPWLIIFHHQQHPPPALSR